MKILIPSIYDDNFGDMLIRHCFESLLRAALDELGLSAQIDIMPLKEIDEQMVRRAEYIFFPGGGTFGLCYTGFFDYIERIVNIAQETGIPVVFSSVGFDNQDATPEGEERLRTLLHKDCVKAISVRDDAQLFGPYAEGSGLDVKQVCDPAVWTRSVCDLSEKHEQGKIVGINVVRGGLFGDNKHGWRFKDELNYLDELKKLLNEAGYDYRFYTNGSILDDNALHYFARQYGIPTEKTMYINSTRELVNAIEGFDFVCAIRMHSSIIAYALGVPAINAVWNDKIYKFYANIGRPDDAIAIENYSAKIAFDKAVKGIDEGRRQPDEAFLMSTYEFIFDTLKELTGATGERHRSFDEIKRCMERENIPKRDEQIDHMTKIKRAEKLYLDRFTDVKARDREIKKLTNSKTALTEKLNKLKESNAQLKGQLKRKERALERKQKELSDLKRHPLVRLDIKLRRVFKKVKRRLKNIIKRGKKR